MKDVCMVSTYFYNGNEYKPCTQKDSINGFIAASIVSGGITGFMPIFGKPYVNQMYKEHLQNDLYEKNLEQGFANSRLSEKGVTITRAQFLLSPKYMQEKAGTNAHFDPVNKTVVLNTEKASILGFHELGHAKNFMTKGMGNFLLKLRTPGMVLSGFFGLIAILSRNKPKEAEKNAGDFIKDNCGKLAFVSMLPVVIEEAMASGKGIKLAKGTGLSDTLIKNMRKLYSKAWLTYLAKAGLTGLAVGAAGMITDYYTRPKKVNSDKLYLLDI